MAPYEYGFETDQSHGGRPERRFRPDEAPPQPASRLFQGTSFCGLLERQLMLKAPEQCAARLDLAAGSRVWHREEMGRRKWNYGTAYHFPLCVESTQGGGRGASSPHCSASQLRAQQRRVSAAALSPGSPCWRHGTFPHLGFAGAEELSSVPT